LITWQEEDVRVEDTP